MNKTDREYFENRVTNIVRCTNGNITDILNKTKQKIDLTNEVKFQFIVSKKASLKSEHDLINEKTGYNDTLFNIILCCFDYPETKTQQRQKLFNKTIDQRIEALMQEVTLEGKRLVDKAVLNLIELKNIPDALHKLSEMANIARVTKPKFKRA